MSDENQTYWDHYYSCFHVPFSPFGDDDHLMALPWPEDDEYTSIVSVEHRKLTWNGSVLTNRTTELESGCLMALIALIQSYVSHLA